MIKIKKFIKNIISILKSMFRFQIKPLKRVVDSHEIKVKNKKINSLYKKNQNVLRQNDYYKNINFGKRCLIVGNGPSIKNFDFSKFKNFDIFTCNLIGKLDKARDLKPKYHFICDNNFYLDSRPDISKYLEMLTKENDKIVFFFPADAKNTKLIKKISLHKINYFQQTNLIDNTNFTKYLKSFNLTPIYRSVILYAIHFAIYSSYKEIYLIGSEQTNILMLLQAKLNQLENIEYGYQTTEEDIKFIKNYFSQTSLSYKLSEFSILFDQFDALHKYAIKKNIKIYNLTAKTLLESIPHIDINDINF